MKNDIDLTGVDPVRVAEIRRRVAILDRYAALRRPALEIREDHARRLGISVSQLYHLARVWRINRSAASIPGARSRFGGQGPRRLDPRSLEIAARAIDELGPLSSRKSVLNEVARRCAEEGVAAPSNATITNMLAEARSTMGCATGLKPEILIDEVTVKLPVQDGDQIIMPRVMMAVALPQRRIIAVAISCTADADPSAKALIAKVEQAAVAGGIALGVRVPNVLHGELAALGIRAHPGRRDEPQMGRVLGARLADLGLLYRTSMARPGSTLSKARHATALDAAEARRLIVAAIDDHNAALPEMPAEGFSISASPNP